MRKTVCLLLTMCGRLLPKIIPMSKCWGRDLGLIAVPFCAVRRQVLGMDGNEVISFLPWINRFRDLVVHVRNKRGKSEPEATARSDDNRKN